ncbi:BTB/POZ and MATH domain-containing protein 1-like [Triticum dicoccoides]|uniref:BTB/POZ and MATH domain-containing protein 1-like n=1 Tax=Triticum dicoccoides TaxID=85692 RepID=UPI00189044FB|nr:BTB/POZ and MATH domain-containing protein 1-like [Triticum dicoccoides]
MSSAIAAAGKPSGSASAIVGTSARGYHTLKIDGYWCTKVTPTGEFLQSSQFSVGGRCWRINYYPNGMDSQTAGYISIYLKLDEIATEDVKAMFTIGFAKVPEKRLPWPWACTPVSVFGGEQMRGYRKFIKREDLEKSEYLKDDSFTIRCEIVVVQDICTKEARAPKFVTVPPPQLNQHLGDLLKTGKGADVVFEVGGESIAAHRCVLASRSSVFNVELFGAMKEGNTASVIRIDDMEAQVFKALLYFAYTDSLLETEKEDEEAMYPHLLVAADMYDMERLKLICEEKLCEHIKIDSVPTILALAEKYHCNGLKKACFDFLSCPARRRAVVSTDGFKHLYKSFPSLVMELISMPSPP